MSKRSRRNKSRRNGTPKNAIPHQQHKAAGNCEDCRQLQEENRDLRQQVRQRSLVGPVLRAALQWVGWVLQWALG